MSPGADPLGASGSGRPPWSAFRAALEALDFRPSKTLGQNFLIDPASAHAIALDAGLSAGERVLEIGAGCGFLTLHLAELGFELLAVEIDGRLLGVAQRLLGERPNVRWLHLDALAGKHALAPELVSALPAEEPWNVVANLPYSISAPLLALLARLPNPPARMGVLVQDEVARRIAAAPGEEAWGALGARLALLYRARLGRGVGAQLFWPRPRVASRVVHLERRAGAAPAAAALDDYDALVEALFRGRRKQLLTSLGTALGARAPAEAMLRSQGLDPRVRGETLAPEILLALAGSEVWRDREVR